MYLYFCFDLFIFAREHDYAIRTVSEGARIEKNLLMHAVSTFFGESLSVVIYLLAAVYPVRLMGSPMALFLMLRNY